MGLNKDMFPIPFSHSLASIISLVTFTIILSVGSYGPDLTWLKSPFSHPQMNLGIIHFTHTCSDQQDLGSPCSVKLQAQQEADEIFSRPGQAMSECQGHLLNTGSLWSVLGCSSNLSCLVPLTLNCTTSFTISFWLILSLTYYLIFIFSNWVLINCLALSSMVSRKDVLLCLATTI